jgi:hypothetical protein
LTGSAPAGAGSLSVQGTNGFGLGDTIVINQGGQTEEQNEVAGFGSITLARPLRYAHGPGESVRSLGRPAPAAKPDNDDRQTRRLTEGQRQQRDRTNQLGLDDYRTEGNVVEVRCDGDEPSITIALRDGLQRVVLRGNAAQACGRFAVGDYLEAEGVKEHEGLFYADEVTRSQVR